jgi:hypothetical protein
MITEELHKTKCRMQYKLCQKIIDEYIVKYTALKHILSNIEYNQNNKKIKKTFSS